MDPLKDVLNVVSGDAERHAILIGVVSAVYLSVRYWQSSNLDLFRTVFFAGLLVGLVCYTSDGELRRAGGIVGLLGSVSVIWVGADMLAFISRLEYSIWSDTVQSTVLFIGLGIIVSLAVLSGLVGALLGHWLGTKAARYRPDVA